MPRHNEMTAGVVRSLIDAGKEGGRYAADYSEVINASGSLWSAA